MGSLGGEVPGASGAGAAVRIGRGCFAIMASAEEVMKYGFVPGVGDMERDRTSCVNNVFPGIEKVVDTWLRMRLMSVYYFPGALCAPLIHYCMSALVPGD